VKFENYMVAVAFDGTRFFSEEECAAYEAAHWQRQLVGMTLEQVEAALAREDVDRADALEKAGQRIARKRLADGERRRKAPNPPADVDALARVEQSKPLISAIPEEFRVDHGQGEQA
jgi:DNA-binding transcriptional MerR regulator